MLRITSSEFMKGATKSAEWPKTNVPEFAFFGRSNVGKSSLINMFANRKSLVKAGSRPGMTRIINFFLINGAFTIADLPGYGYAQRSAEENEDFNRMLADYVSTRTVLKTVFFLLDMRREQGDVERESVEYFERLNLEVIIVGTKADKLGQNEIANTRKKWGEFFKRSPELILVTSSTKNTGRDDLLRAIGDRL